jgi:hypothetical protein
MWGTLMLRQITSRNQQTQLPVKFMRGLQVLADGYWYSTDVGCDRWEFAVSIQRLEHLGLDEGDLRWLVMKGLIEHAKEVTVPGDDGRQFRPIGNLTFCERTCVVLTDRGAADVGCLIASRSSPANEVARVEAIQSTHGTLPPIWDAVSRRLSLNGYLIKRFKWPAINQEAILCAFQEDGWPARIDDPLPQHPDQDPKRRLADTIKCLNRKQTNALIHFCGDGTGEGVLWERIDN